jgi:hypothetical protein
MTKPQVYKYYQHRYGGVYEVLVPEAKSTVDKSLWTVYNHVWPFDREAWIRPYSEWTDGRFRELTGDEVRDLFARNREEFQNEISAARKIAKG